MFVPLQIPRSGLVQLALCRVPDYAEEKPMDRFGANNNGPLRFDSVGILRMAR